MEKKFDISILFFSEAGIRSWPGSSLFMFLNQIVPQKGPKCQMAISAAIIGGLDWSQANDNYYFYKFTPSQRWPFELCHLSSYGVCHLPGGLEVRWLIICHQRANPPTNQLDTFLSTSFEAAIFTEFLLVFVGHCFPLNARQYCQPILFRQVNFS